MEFTWILHHFHCLYCLVLPSLGPKRPGAGTGARPWRRRCSNFFQGDVWRSHQSLRIYCMLGVHMMTYFNTTYAYIYNYTYIHTCMHADRQTDRHTYMQIHTYIHVKYYMCRRDISGQNCLHLSMGIRRSVSWWSLFHWLVDKQAAKPTRPSIFLRTSLM